jgi:hypothetical protein
MQHPPVCSSRHAVCRFAVRHRAFVGLIILIVFSTLRNFERGIVPKYGHAGCRWLGPLMFLVFSRLEPIIMHAYICVYIYTSDRSCYLCMRISGHVTCVMFDITRRRLDPLHRTCRIPMLPVGTPNALDLPPLFPALSVFLSLCHTHVIMSQVDCASTSIHTSHTMSLVRCTCV